MSLLLFLLPGSGVDSIYGGAFDDEGFLFRHDRGVVSMAASAPNRNGCQFMVCLEACEAFDSTAVAFGRVVSGLRVRASVCPTGGVCASRLSACAHAKQRSFVGAIASKPRRVARVQSLSSSMRL